MSGHQRPKENQSGTFNPARSRENNGRFTLRNTISFSLSFGSCRLSFDRAPCVQLTARSVLHTRGIATAKTGRRCGEADFVECFATVSLSRRKSPAERQPTHIGSKTSGNARSGRNQGRRAFLRSLASLFRSLHAQQIYHDDLKHSNILVVNNGGDESFEWFLLDLEGVREYARLSERRRIKNLVQLYRTLGRYVSRSRQAFFLKCYLGRSFADPKLKRHFVDGVLMRAKSVDRIKARVYPRGVEIDSRCARLLVALHSFHSPLSRSFDELLEGFPPHLDSYRGQKSIFTGGLNRLSFRKIVREET